MSRIINLTSGMYIGVGIQLSGQMKQHFSLLSLGCSCGGKVGVGTFFSLPYLIWRLKPILQLVPLNNMI